MLGKNKGVARDISLGIVELLLITCVALESYLTFSHLVFPLKKQNRQTNKNAGDSYGASKCAVKMND